MNPSDIYFHFSPVITTVIRVTICPKEIAKSCSLVMFLLGGEGGEKKITFPLPPPEKNRSRLLRVSLSLLSFNCT